MIDKHKEMKKIIKLTESELQRIVKKVLNEQEEPNWVKIRDKSGAPWGNTIKAMMDLTNKMSRLGHNFSDEWEIITDKTQMEMKACKIEEREDGVYMNMNSCVVVKVDPI